LDLQRRAEYLNILPPLVEEFEECQANEEAQENEEAQGNEEFQGSEEVQRNKGPKS
jgi:hypothetical protein